MYIYCIVLFVCICMISHCKHSNDILLGMLCKHYCISSLSKNKKSTVFQGRNHLWWLIFIVQCKLCTSFKFTHKREVVYIYRVSQKRGTHDFRYFDIQKYSIFWFYQIKHCLLKRMIPRSLKLVEKFWFYGHFLKHSHCLFSPSFSELFSRG